MKTINFIDKDSDVVITTSGDSEEETRNNVRERLKYFDIRFYAEEIEEDS